MPSTRTLLILLSFVAACSSTEPQPAATDVTAANPTWHAGPTAAIDGRLTEDWWTAFEQPGLTLSITTALENNYDLMAAAARVQAVTAQARAVAGDRLPHVNAGLGLTRNRTNIIGLPFAGSPEVLPITNNNFNLGVDLSWEIDLWGRLEASENAAIARVEASDADFAATRLSLAGQTAKAWLARTDALAQLEIAQQQLKNAEAQYAYWELKIRYQSAADALLQAEAALALAKAAIPEATDQYEMWNRQLASLMGAYPGNPSGDVPAKLPSLPGPVPVGLPADLVQRRPDLASAEASVREARSSSTAADASLYPALSLTGSGGTSTNELQDLLDLDFRTWSLGASLTAPLFHGGTRAQADAAEKMAIASELQFAQNLLRALAEVENALGSETQIQTRVGELQSQWRLLKQRTANTENRYQAGVGEAFSIYQQRAEALRAQSSLHSAQLLLLANRIDLYLALGGGFQTSPQR
ncbi:MAG: TolC family protein [Planctomycetota bacterium]|nr:TolC family protein [Planctomycetota bacterium]